MPLCGCYLVCSDCFFKFFGPGQEEKKISCPVCDFESRRELFVHARGSVLGPEDREYERVTKRVNKIFNHSRGQLDSLQKYNQYLDNKYETIYKLTTKTDVQETEKAMETFELQNRNTIQQNNSNQGIAQAMNNDKHLYIIEEYKRITKNKLTKERLVDQYTRSYIDEKEFSTKTHALLGDPTQTSINLITSDIKETAKSYSYTPNDLKQQEEQAFQFPKPIDADMTLEKARYLSHKKSITPEIFKQSKEAGGWSSNVVMNRYKELAFGCLFTT